jgi:hypothetical protein
MVGWKQFQRLLNEIQEYLMQLFTDEINFIMTREYIRARGEKA